MDEARVAHSEADGDTAPGPEVVVEVPAEWLAAVGRSRRLIARGGTVRECLEDLARRQPAVADLRRGVGLTYYVNWQNVRYRQGLDTLVAPGDTVQIVLFRA